MSTLALVINQNQNEVSVKEIAKIKKAVQSAEPTREIKVYANDAAFDPTDTDYKENDCVVFNTKDANNKVSAILVFGHINGVHEISL